MARCFSDSGNANPNAQPWEGVSVLDASGSVIADLSSAGQRGGTEGDPYAICSISLAPGSYALRYPIRSGNEAAASTLVTQSLIIPAVTGSAGWRLEIYLLRRLDSPDQSASLRISLLMMRAGAQSVATDQEMLLEKAQVALADERPALSAELDGLLLLKFDNPIAGIVGGHLLLIEHDSTGRSLDLLNEVVKNLRGLVGSEQPDVEALSTLCPDPALRRARPVAGAPLFERSWRLLITASQRLPQRLPLESWERIHAATATAPPFLTWSTDSTTRQEFRAALKAALFEQRAVPRGISVTASGSTKSAQTPITTGAPPVISIVQSVMPAANPGPIGSMLSGILATFRGVSFKKASPPMQTPAPAPEVSIPAAAPATSVPSQGDLTMVDQGVHGRRAVELGLPPAALEALRTEYHSRNDP